MLHGCPLKSASMLIIRMHKISIHQSGSLSSPDTGTSLKSKHIFIVIPGKQDFHRYKKGKKKAAANKLFLLLCHMLFTTVLIAYLYHQTA